MNPRDFTGGRKDRPAVRALIEEAATGVALVYLVPEGETGLAIVVRGKAATTIELPRLTMASLSDRLGGVVDAKHSRIAAPRNAWFIDVGTWLWDVAMGPILAAVKGGELVLVACGLTSALPLHAAWRPGPGRRHYVLEDVVIRYAPNARWARGEYAAEAGYRSVLAVGNPRSRLPALRHAEDEIRAIPRTLDVKRLVGGDAERGEILQRWEKFDILHFACHGYGSVDDPLSGGVVLADDLELTARNVIDRRLDAHPLVILSACETAITGARLPDEVVSLQSAFLAAGARGVVATLWPVDDKLTARLISRFYHELVDRRRSPAAALRQSQRWMIDATEPSAEERRRGWPAQSAREAVGPSPTWAAFTYAGL
jgi:CHAT domain-containing protein